MVKNLLDYLDAGKSIEDLSGMNDDIRDEIVEGLKTIGFED